MNELQEYSSHQFELFEYHFRADPNKGLASKNPPNADSSCLDSWAFLLATKQAAWSYSLFSKHWLFKIESVLSRRFKSSPLYNIFRVQCFDQSNIRKAPWWKIFMSKRNAWFGPCSGTETEGDGNRHTIKDGLTRSSGLRRTNSGRQFQTNGQEAKTAHLRDEWSRGKDSSPQKRLVKR